MSHDQFESDNPYTFDMRTDLADSDSVETEDTPRPQLWSVFLLFILSFGLFLFVSTISLLFAHAVVHGIGVMPSEASIRELVKSPLGFTLTLVPSQLAILVPAMIAASLSPVKFSQRLGLVQSRWPVWLWIAGAISTPFIGMLSGMALTPFIEESEQLKQMSEAFRTHASSGFLVPLVLLVGGLPAICEEVLFRGHIQTRLAQRLGAPAAILLASLGFAIYHMDPVHVIAVFPIGIWLGFLRHASGSLYPAMLAHAANNVLSVVSVLPDGVDAMDTPDTPLLIIIILIGLPAVILTIFASFRVRPEQPDDNDEAPASDIP